MPPSQYARLAARTHIGSSFVQLKPISFQVTYHPSRIGFKKPRNTHNLFAQLSH